jgi:hypothetical protein
MRKLVASCSAVVIVVGSAALAACGGSGGSSKAGGNTTTSSGGPLGSILPGTDALSKLAAGAAKQKFKVTYTGLGGSEQVYAQDGRGKSVYGTPGAQIFTSPSGSVSCGPTAAGTVTCTPLPSSYSSASPFVGYSTTSKSYLNALGGLGKTSTKTIAGRTAECVTFSADDLPGPAAALGAALKGSATHCFDKSTGVLLEVSGTDASGRPSTALTVTKFEEPTAADFTPPATNPATIPGD